MVLQVTRLPNSRDGIARYGIARHGIARHGGDALRPRPLHLERLEDRRMLSARAADAVNLFGFDAYQHMQQAEGNLLFSPLSVATALSMTYAGAAGQTAAEIEQVAHLGSEPGIHIAFADLMTSLAAQNRPFVETIDFSQNPPVRTLDPTQGFILDLANAMWPDVSFPVKEPFQDIIETDYQGHVENVDFNQPMQAEETINNWVSDQTQGNIDDLVQGLSPLTRMVLTNSVYFEALWQMPFDPAMTNETGTFWLDESDTVTVPVMVTQLIAPRTNIGGFDILDLPLVEGNSSFVLMVPEQLGDSNVVPTDVLVQVSDWLDGPRIDDYVDLYLPRFSTEVATDLKQLLSGLGMATAFDGGANFSGITDGPLFIQDVSHKATIEVNEQGTQAAAATEVVFGICFVAGTPVRTLEGEKPIEQLEVGDLVLARDENNLEGELIAKRVLETFHGNARIVDLHIGGQVIRTTEGHPFYAYRRGWTEAKELKAGDRVSTDAAGWVEIEQVVETGTAQPVYNLRVADVHTYFIGRESWGFSVWVHNGCVGDFHADRPFSYMIRNHETSTIVFLGRLDDPTQSTNDIDPSVIEVNADFDGDQDVDGADFLAWQRGYGADSGAQPAEGDSDGDGDVDASDMAAWFDTYGQGGEASSNDGEIAEQTSALQAVSSPSGLPAGLVDAAIALEVTGADINGAESDDDDMWHVERLFAEFDASGLVS